MSLSPLEYAQRYYLLHYALLVPSLELISDLFTCRILTEFMTGRLVFWDTYMNLATSKRPVPGSLLIWTNHVAVVASVSKNYVYCTDPGKRKLPIRHGVIVSEGLLGWKMPPNEGEGLGGG
jgi:hypothetical protein